MSNRPETGPMEFGTDWRGVFIRGDAAGWFALNLRRLLGDPKAADVGTPAWQLTDLLSTLEGSNQFAGAETQVMRPFSECVAPDSAPDSKDGVLNRSQAGTDVG